MKTIFLLSARAESSASGSVLFLTGIDSPVKEASITSRAVSYDSGICRNLISCFDVCHSAKLETRRFATLEEYAANTGQDRHSVLLDYDVFVNVPMLDARDTASVQKLYDARDFDFRLKPRSAAVDRGVVLPTVTEGYSGRAPDLGALEPAAPLPVYGPRP